MSSLRQEERASYQEHSISMFFICGFECRLNILGGSHFEILKMHADRISGDGNLSQSLRLLIALHSRPLRLNGDCNGDHCSRK